MNADTPRRDEIKIRIPEPRAIEQMTALAGELESENARLKKIECAARQWWKAKGRHNAQIAACKLGEALGHTVTWPEGYIPANVPVSHKGGSDDDC